MKKEKMTEEEKKEKRRQRYLKNRTKILEQMKLRYNENKEEILEKNKQYRIKNKEILNEKDRNRNKSRYIDNKERVLERHRKYKNNNKEKIKDRQKRYYETNKEKIKIANKLWIVKNNDRWKHYQTHYRYSIKDIYNEKRRNDPFFKIRSRLTKAVRQYNLNKNHNTLKYLGCDLKTLYEWLQFSGEQYDSNFNIFNYSGYKYHIDHIKTFEDVYKGIYTLEEVCHYTNLQILPAEINLSKGGTSWIE